MVLAVRNTTGVLNLVHNTCNDWGDGCNYGYREGECPSDGRIWKYTGGYGGSTKNYINFSNNEIREYQHSEDMECPYVIQGKCIINGCDRISITNIIF